MIKTINILLILTIFFWILFLTWQRNDYSGFDLLERTEGIIHFSYNTISIKQIDSLTSNANLKFSGIFVEKVKLK